MTNLISASKSSSKSGNFSNEVEKVVSEMKVKNYPEFCKNVPLYQEYRKVSKNSKQDLAICLKETFGLKQPIETLRTIDKDGFVTLAANVSSLVSVSVKAKLEKDMGAKFPQIWAQMVDEVKGINNNIAIAKKAYLPQEIEFKTKLAESLKK